MLPDVLLAADTMHKFLRHLFSRRHVNLLLSGHRGRAYKQQTALVTLYEATLLLNVTC